MYHLIYTSHAIVPYNQDDLIELLRQSRAYNRQHHITGMLLYLNGKFIQVLEGNKESVLELYDSICHDPKHQRVMKIMEGTSPSRIFKDWSMGFKKLSDSDFHHLTGYKDIDHFFEEKGGEDKGTLLMTFLTLFYKKNLVDYAEIPDSA
jgi:hypothetical protein